jgi:hypothetical protein
MGLVIDHHDPEVSCWPLLFVAMITNGMLARPLCVLVEVESTRAIALMILEALCLGFGFGFAGASVALALAPRRVVGVFRVHVFSQAMFKVDCHCCPFQRTVVLFVSHEYIISSCSCFVNPKTG